MLTSLLAIRGTFLPALLLCMLHAAAQTPVVSSFSPASGNIGAAVTITGTDFNPVPGNNIVFFGAVRAQVTGGSTTSLTFTVPAGSSYKPVSVLNNATKLTGFANRAFVPTFTDAPGAGLSDSFYTAPVMIGTGSVSSFPAIAIGDIDDNGKPDLVFTADKDGSVSILRNVSTPRYITGSSFSPPVKISVGSGAVSSALGDLDGDGKPDPVTVNGTLKSFSVYRNTATRGRIDVSAFDNRINFQAEYELISVRIGDIDGDGKPDLVIKEAYGRYIIYRNNATSPGFTSASFKPGVVARGGYFPTGLNPEDMDDDGKPDMVYGESGGPEYWQYNGTSARRNVTVQGSINESSFDPIVNLPSGSQVQFKEGRRTRDVATADMDGDGKPDVIAVVTTGYYTGGQVLITQNASPRGMLKETCFNTKISMSTLGTSVVTGDLDGNGKPDVLNGSMILRNTSTPGNFSVSSFTLSNPIGGRIIHDLNGDGIPEIIGASSGISRVFPNPFTESFKMSFHNPSAANDIQVGIYDGNGKLVYVHHAGQLPAGNATVTINLNGRQIPPGVYLAALRLNGVPSKGGQLVKAR